MLPASATKLHAELRRACLPCHVRGAPAGATRYVLSGEPGADLAATRAFVDGTAAASSLVATKAAGREHGGGAPWPVGSAPHLALLAWIAEGAPAAPPAPAPAAAPVAVGAEAEAAAAAVAPVPTPPPLPAQPPPLAPLPPGHRAVPGLSVSFLSQTLSLNGRFDMNLERRGFRSNPFDDAGATAFQSYHHFLFLSRTSTEDPFTFTAEIVNLELYEIAARLGPRRGPFKINVRAGKVLVPFGNEPLFHQSYGGHAGFDQRVLPAIWAAEGAVASGSTRWRGLSASADLYAVKGYALRRADAVLNLKNDFSPLDDARVALGARVGLAWGPLSGFYSTYANRLGFGRLLFMQALDVGLWRWRGGVVPGLDRLVLGAGLLRADVSGGGAGQDYYHFASYWLARVYLFDWLHLQYRQGLRTFNNRRGVIGDSTRWDSDDGSTHNLTLTARVRGLQVALAYHLNFEKAGEIDDDLFRLAVAYEF